MYCYLLFKAVPATSSASVTTGLLETGEAASPTPLQVRPAPRESEFAVGRDALLDALSVPAALAAEVAPRSLEDEGDTSDRLAGVSLPAGDQSCLTSPVCAQPASEIEPEIALQALEVAPWPSLHASDNLQDTADMGDLLGGRACPSTLAPPASGLVAAVAPPRLPDPFNMALLEFSVFGRSSALAAPWWHSLVSPGLRSRVAASGDIVWCLPDQALDESGMLEHCCSVVRHHTALQFYIGITERPDERWEAHARSGYSAMHIIACAVTSATTARIERALIARFRSYRCANLSAGGERASAGSPHFVYIVYRADLLTRRAATGGGSRARSRITVMEDLYGPM
jgi:hypothetical protein